MNPWILGGLAGLAATLPMTAAMRGVHRRLSRRQQHDLPPRQITIAVAEKAGLDKHLDEGKTDALTTLGHYAYGAVAGGLYGALQDRLRQPSLLTGILYGLSVWGASYQGWVPAAGILPPATRKPAGRNVMMIVAHLVWGAFTAALFEWMETAEHRTERSVESSAGTGSASAE